MTPPPLLAGVDVGTTHTKVGLWTADGTVVALQRRSTVDDAEELVTAVLEAVAEVVAGTGGDPPVAVGVASMAETGVALDAALRPLHPLLRWDDPRAAADAEALAGELGRAEVFAATGVSLAARTPLARWRWLCRTAPDLLRRTRTWVSAADLVVAALTGEPVTDPTLAGRTGGYRQDGAGYDPDLLAAAGLRPDQLPRVAPAGEPAGTVTAPAARATGLAAGTPVLVAGHDHLVAAHAAGVREPGQIADSLGTAEAVVTVSDRPPPADAVHTGLSWNRSADGAAYCLVSGLPAAGRLLDWCCAALLDRPGDYAAFADLVATARSRPTGIVVEPYPHGRAAPAPDPDRRLAVHGVTAAHTRADLALAVLEGACYHARWMAEAQAAHAGGQPVRELTVLGGPTRSAAWMAVKAAVTPAPVRVATTADAACAGAALRAGAVVGLDPPPLPATPVPATAADTTAYDRVYRQFLDKAGA
jgi:xylulokinase